MRIASTACEAVNASCSDADIGASVPVAQPLRTPPTTDEATTTLEAFRKPLRDDRVDMRYSTGRRVDSGRGSRRKADRRHSTPSLERVVTRRDLYVHPAQVGEFATSALRPLPPCLTPRNGICGSSCAVTCRYCSRVHLGVDQLDNTEGALLLSTSFGFAISIRTPQIAQRNRFGLSPTRSPNSSCGE